MSNSSYRVEVIQYYDEVLAQSARNYAFTSDKKWEKIYRETEPISDRLLKDAIKKEGAANKDFFSKMYATNQKLVKMEHAVIDFVNDSKPKYAIDLLDSEKYIQQRKILTGGLEEFVKHCKKESDSPIVSRPVKEIIELERRLAILEKQLKEEKFIAIGHLASRMAHDLRNPLSIISMSLENLKEMYEVDDIKQKLFDKIERSIDRITHQVDEVLDFVRERPLTLDKTKMTEIISESLDTLNIPKNIKLILPKNDVELICDKKQLVIALDNLILNSIQAIEGKGMVSLSINEKNDSIIIEIEDSGSGIPKDKVDDIFEPLFTTKQQGTGLGLASVKSIIEAHRGSISVTSPPTIFMIELPKNQIISSK
ncbi:sensor histidine kinase [Nitrosopumilus ureiphilus]|uniref:Histidine kinase domain-containing protein n=1 Tax=Nitrosopumilus ureiphilus TaxID=1470067 RepID=A0A7D5M4C5_9ARCH|nr:HAMP domain-containing sensor histidine kinase [Nitrosopumilus ureiphilus]QLH06846.1 hypothetical protein C5F50_06970 [Nitrosopumilus ureiphilus]